MLKLGILYSMMYSCCVLCSVVLTTLCAVYSCLVKHCRCSVDIYVEYADMRNAFWDAGTGVFTQYCTWRLESVNTLNTHDDANMMGCK